MFKTGDEIITVSSLWHRGKDIGDRLGRIIDTKSYILIDLYNYENNPIKCFRHEISILNTKTEEDKLMEEINEALEGWPI